MADEVVRNCVVTVRKTQIVVRETIVHRIVHQTPAQTRVVTACRQGPPGPPGEEGPEGPAAPAGSFEWNSTNW